MGTPQLAEKVLQHREQQQRQAEIATTQLKEAEAELSAAEVAAIEQIFTRFDQDSDVKQAEQGRVRRLPGRHRSLGKRRVY